MACLFVEYHKNLFSSSNPIQMTAVLKATPRVPTGEMNEKFLGEFSRLEVGLALKQMSPLKALGPDGIPPIFYQQYWDKIGANVYLAVLTCLNIGKTPASINHTYITLIPKIKCPERVM